MDRRSHAAEETVAAVAATPAALEVVHRVEAAHGPLMLFQSGGCCDGTSPICMKDGELPAGSHDVRLGHIGRAPFYIDSDQYHRWGTPRFLIDVSSGAAEGFSLEGLEGCAFRLSRTVKIRSSRSISAPKRVDSLASSRIATAVGVVRLGLDPRAIGWIARGGSVLGVAAVG
jgi:uncharacterized protein